MTPLWPDPDPRTLQVEFLWLTRDYRPAEQWELPRGFRVATLEAGWFALFLGSRGLGPDCDPLSLQPGPGEEAFLLGLPPREAGPNWLEQGRDCLRSLSWPVGVVALLADYRQRAHLGELRRHSRACFSGGLPCGAAFWVWQPMPGPRRGPGLAFFAVEQQLYQWGRVGRHVRRRCRLRRLWPW